MQYQDQMDRLKFYYQEHAEQARQHENQRERMTNIVLAIAGALIGVVTFAELALWSLPAALAVSALGLYGLVFAQKHYERNRYHVYILREIRKEMDYVGGFAQRPADIPKERTLEQIREAGVRAHFKKFTKSDATTVVNQAATADTRLDDLDLLKANSRYVCRIRVHKLWEGFHWLVFGLGIFICLVIIGQFAVPSDRRQPMKVEIVPSDHQQPLKVEIVPPDAQRSPKP